MASKSAKTRKTPVQVKLADGSLFVCSCRSTEFRSAGEDTGLHLFCACGQVYVPKDLPPLWEGILDG